MAAVLLFLGLLAPAVFADSSILKQMQTSDFTGFLRLLEHADLVPEIESALNSGKAMTVFAPTDEALMHHTSPTLLAFLKLAENKDALRKVLLNHFVADRLSPFKWDGVRSTLEGSPLKLNMDAQAFYANDVAVKQYNALVSGEASLHSIPTLIIPSGMATSTKQYVDEATTVRRVLQGALAPAPAIALPTDNDNNSGSPVSEGGDINAASAGSLVSIFTMSAALIAALLL